jgi:hypothetical protein
MPSVVHATGWLKRGTTGVDDKNFLGASWGVTVWAYAKGVFGWVRIVCCGTLAKKFPQSNREVEVGIYNVAE